MFNPLLSVYKKITISRTKDKYTLSEVFEVIRSGSLYKPSDVANATLDCRSIENKKLRDEFKQSNVPYLAHGGVFGQRSDSGLQAYSGLIQLDFDQHQNQHLPEENFGENVRDLLKDDKHTVLAFVSIGGKGCAVMFSTDHSHTAKTYGSSFSAAVEYVRKKYELIADPSVSSISEARFFSWDPNAYLNLEAEAFNETLELEQGHPQKAQASKPKTANFVGSADDFSVCLKKIIENQIDITEGYGEWLRLGFAIASKFGNDGREYFHQISQFSSTYDANECDRQFDACLKGGAKEGGTTIAYFFKKCKEHGIYATSEKRQSETVTLELENDDTESGRLGEFIASRGVYFDVICRQLFWNHAPMNDQTINDLYLQAINTMYDANRKRLPKQFFETVLISSLTPQVNRFQEFLASLPETTGTETIEKLIDGLRMNEKDGGISRDFTKRWLVSIIANMHAMEAFDNGQRFEVSPLVLALIDERGGAGKSYFFEHLLPESLQSFFYSTQFDESNVKDEYIKMTTNLICFVDEADEVLADPKKQAKFKYCTSNTVFDARTPHAKHSEKRPKLAVFCAASNYDTLLVDNERNRRIIPVRLTGEMDWNLHNSIDRVQLFAELYSLYKAGFQWRIVGEDIKKLAQIGVDFVAHNAPMEILEDNFEQDHTSSPRSLSKIISEVMPYIRIDNSTLASFADAARRLGWKKSGRNGYKVKRK